MQFVAGHLIKSYSFHPYRRMFPSMRVSLSGLEEEASYCVLLEMVPIGDCRYKFSGSQWVPAGGAEPQSPQRMYLHPDSPATGAHWQSQALLFNKVKLTNNTLDSSGHVSLNELIVYLLNGLLIVSINISRSFWPACISTSHACTSSAAASSPNFHGLLSRRSFSRRRSS